MQIIEPYRQEEKMSHYLTEETKKVGIVFFHGLGDCVQFIVLYDKLKELYPNIKFDIFLQKGLGQTVVFPEAIELGSLDEIDSKEEYDYIFLVHFPVEVPGMTKSELCCKTELGIDPTWGHTEIPKKFPSKFIAVHFQNTALPDVFNPSKEVAEKIWNEILEAGFIPIEVDFQHVYHNPVNEKFDFVDCTVRRAKPTVETLLGTLRMCAGAICAVSGPLHCALSMMPDQVLYLEKGVPIERFTYLDIPSVDVKNYKEGKVREWLNTLM